MRVLTGAIPLSIFLLKNLLLSKIICKFAVEMMAWCYHLADKKIRYYGTIGSYSQDRF